MRRPALLLLLFTALAAALVAGCGDDDGGSDDVGPAAAVPATAPIYFEFAVKPEGSAKEGAEAAAAKILDTPDPGARIVELIEQSAADEGDPVDFEQDVEPWLGESGAVFLRSFENDEGTFVVESTDAAAAIAFLSSQSDATGRTGTYEGHDYEFNQGGDVFGAVGDFIVQGPEEGFKAAVDADSGDSLGDNEEFKGSLDDVSDDSIASLYADPKKILDAIPAAELDPGSRSILEQTIGDAADEPIVGDLTASASDISFELSAGSSGVETNESALLSELPGSAWLGIGLADIGDAVQRGLDATRQAGIPGFDIDQINSQLSLATGHDLEEIAGSLGEGAIFVEGTSERQLAGALVVESKDPALTGDILNRLGTLLRQGSDPKETTVEPLASTGGDQGFRVTDHSGDLAQPVDIIQRDDKLVIGYGPNAAAQALEGGDTLSGTAAFTSAKDRLSDLGVDAFLSFAPVFQLAESAGAGDDPDYQQAKPYIDALDYVAVGSGDEDDRALVKFVIGLK